ncbi:MULTISPECIES: thiamine phosphate synthase [Bacillaceae]|jgi:thiamine-phosphate pyrophosphorylase|uniref:thiamine phosphate synthase n=1 Tax=Bacillaceae TaxID=186817 RepID=UPI00101D1311|nr:thiamine phosphate synthase [Ectobacillus funiculus]
MSRIQSDVMREMLKVYFIAGSVNCKKDLVSIVEEAIDGGVTLFQYREKGNGALTGDAKYEMAKRVQELCKRKNIPFIVNDDVDLALELDADGVHIGQDDEAAASVREKIGDKILGISVHTLEQAQKAAAQGADYFGVGPIFSTQSKEDARDAQGTALIELFKNHKIETPIVAIGGITAENTPPIIKAGADGVSVISAISQADSVYEAAKKLKEAVFQTV